MNKYIARNIIYPLIQNYIHENVIELMPEVSNFQYLSVNEIQELQWRRLKDMIVHAYKTVPYYKDVFKLHALKPGDINTFEDLKKIPVLKRETVRDNFNKFISTEKSKHTLLSHSGGTMGRPINILRDNVATSLDRAIKVRCTQWYGVDLGDKEARFWGYAISKKERINQKLQDFFLNRIRLSPFELEKEKVIEGFRRMLKFSPKIIYGWLSGIYKTAQIALENNIPMRNLPIKVVVPTAEVLYPHQRNVIEECFGVKVANEYGCSEMGVIAFECPEGNMHLMADSVYMEYLKDNQEVEPGQSGEIIITDLKNKTFPLIRYALGDIGKPVSNSCHCGISLPLMGIHEGRSLDLIANEKGGYIHGAIFIYFAFNLMSTDSKIKDFRIVQEVDKNITFYYVKDNLFDPIILKEFESKIKKYLGKSIFVKFVEIDQISADKSQKNRFVISKYFEQNNKI